MSLYESCLYWCVWLLKFFQWKARIQYLDVHNGCLIWILVLFNLTKMQRLGTMVLSSPVQNFLPCSLTELNESTLGNSPEGLKNVQNTFSSSLGGQVIQIVEMFCTVLSSVDSKGILYFCSLWGKFSSCWFQFWKWFSLPDKAGCTVLKNKLPYICK